MSYPSSVSVADSQLAPPPTKEQTGKRQAAGSGDWIVGPWVDRIGLVYSPLLAVLLGSIVCHFDWTQRQVAIGGYANELSDLFIGTFIFAHLFIVFFRSHGNTTIFRQYPLRFVAVPVALFLAMVFIPWAAVIVAIVAVLWDVYHSCMQTFGIGRIYDAKAGNDATQGRRLDLGINLLLYAGPIFAGTALILHAHLLKQEAAGSGASVFFSNLPIFAIRHHNTFLWATMAVAVPFLGWYLFSYYRLWKNGYEVSWNKVALLVSTAICSIWTWGFNSFGQAFFIMNFFHALQYFVLVWWAEKRNMQNLFGLKGRSWGKGLTMGIFLAVGIGFGLWAEMVPRTNDVAFALIMVVAIMHFWYDGFIWSVRKKEV